MREVYLPQLDQYVPNIGFGTYHLREKVGAADGIDALGQAYEAGIRMFDTSDNYNTEDIIGQAVDEGLLPRDEVVIATKTGLAVTATEATEWARNNEGSDTSPERIRRQVDNSLRLLGSKVGVIDIYQLHVYDESVPPEEHAGVMDELVQEGKIRSFGISNYPRQATVELLDACDAEQLRRPMTTQPFLNILEGPDATVAHAQDEGLVVLGHSPLHKGVLVDSMVTHLRSVVEQAAAANISEEQKAEWRSFGHGLEVVEGLMDVAHQNGLTLQQLALGWMALQPSTIVLTSCVTNEQLRDVAIASSIELSGEDQQKIREMQMHDDHVFARKALSLMRQLKLYYK